MASQILSPSPRLMSAAGTFVKWSGGRLLGLPAGDEFFDPALPFDLGDAELRSGRRVESEDLAERVELLLGITKLLQERVSNGFLPHNHAQRGDDRFAVGETFRCDPLPHGADLVPGGGEVLEGDPIQLRQPRRQVDGPPVDLAAPWSEGDGHHVGCWDEGDRLRFVRQLLPGRVAVAAVDSWASGAFPYVGILSGAGYEIEIERI